MDGRFDDCEGRYGLVERMCWCYNGDELIAWMTNSKKGAVVDVVVYFTE